MPKEEGLNSVYKKGGTGGIAMLPSYQVGALKSYHKKYGKEEGDKKFKYYKKFWKAREGVHKLKKKIKSNDVKKTESRGM